MADSGKIFAIDSALPTQNPRMPPSAYIRVTALRMACAPLTPPPDPTVVPPRSGGRVMRKIFNRSKGAVHVLDTDSNDRQCIGCMSEDYTLPAPATPPARRNFTAALPPNQWWWCSSGSCSLAR
jgi:hypothetical protein